MHLSAACAGRPATSPPASFGTGPAASSAPRSPEGVVLEVPAPNPAPAEASGDKGVIVLVEPTPDDAVRDLVFQFFDALRRKDIESIAQLTSDNAFVMSGRSASGTRTLLLETLLRRMLQHDYSRIAPLDLASVDRVERFSASELAASGIKRNEPMGPFDVFVRVTIPPPRAATEKLFEDYVVFIFRSENGKLRILGVGEEGASPP